MTNTTGVHLDLILLAKICGYPASPNIIDLIIEEGVNIAKR